MRPYFVLCAVLFVSVVAFAQRPIPPGIYGPGYGYGPFVPLATTPMLSLDQYSPNPVGASNATTGLVAGATNATLSEPVVDTSSVYTVPVWYQGGDAPRTTSAIHLFPEQLARPMRMMAMEHGHGEEAHAGWVYFSGIEHTGNAVNASAAAKGGKKAARTYTNEDVDRQNQNNGQVKYNGKTEKM